MLIFLKLLEELQDFKSISESVDKFLAYFDKNWYMCKDMWVYGFRLNLKIGNNNTNNRVESMNKLLKMFIKYKSKMSKCLDGIFNFLNHLSEEVNLKTWNEK